MKKLFGALSAGAILLASHAHADLSAGSIAIIGLNPSSSGATTFAFVALEDIAASEQFIFTDIGWNGTAFDNFSSGDEGYITYTSTGLSAGSIVVISSDTGVVSGGGSAVMTGTFEISDFAFSDPADQLFALDGTLGSPTFVFGLNQGTAWAFDEFDTSNSSALPASLSGAAVTVEDGNGYFQRYWSYDLSTTDGNKASLLAAITNAANWVSTDSPYDFTTIGAFNVIPEPATYAGIAGLLALGLAARRRRAAKA